MQSLLVRARGLLNALLDRATSTKEFEVATLLRSVDEGSAPELPELALLLASPDRAVQEAAAQVARSLLGQLVPLDYVSLDQAVRTRSSYGYPNRLLSEKDLAGFGTLGDAASAAWGLASLNWNGYVREEAVKCLAGVSTGAELPFLLLRLNDWVEQVRAAALEAVEARLQPDSAAPFLRFLPLVLRLEYTQRSRNEKLISRIESFLQAPENAHLLAEGRLSSDREIRRACFRLSFKKTVDSPWDEFGDALRAKDPVVRLWAARVASSLPVSPELRDFFDRLTHDRFVPVRRLALEAFADLFPHESPDRTQFALLDSVASIRDDARRRLSQTERVDFASFYRKAFVEGPAAHLKAAIAGLGETGSASDSSELLPFLSHSSPKIRRTAIRAISTLSRDEHLAAFEQAILDNEPSVSTEARKMLLRRAGLLNQQRLWDQLENDERPHVRKNILLLLDHTGKWDRLFYLLRATLDRDPTLASFARSCLKDWASSFNSSFTTPTPEQLARIDQLLERLGPDFRWLDFYLETFRRSRDPRRDTSPVR